MARVTVEDCLEEIPNRFELILIATKRARELATGGKEPYVEWENDKPTVVALREISEGYIDRSLLSGKSKRTVPVSDVATHPVNAESSQETTTDNHSVSETATPTATQQQTSENPQDQGHLTTTENITPANESTSENEAPINQN